MRKVLELDEISIYLDVRQSKFASEMVGSSSRRSEGTQTRDEVIDARW